MKTEPGLGKGETAAPDQSEQGLDYATESALRWLKFKREELARKIKKVALELSILTLPREPASIAYHQFEPGGIDASQAEAERLGDSQEDDDDKNSPGSDDPEDLQLDLQGLYHDEDFYDQIEARIEGRDLVLIRLLAKLEVERRPSSAGAH